MENIDERQTQHEIDKPSMTGSGGDGSAFERQNRPLAPGETPRPASTAARGEGSSLTQAFPAVSTDEANISRDVVGDSTATRVRFSVPNSLDSQPTVISKQSPSSLTPAVGQLHPLEMGRVLLGQTLGHYELLEFVGGGGMGAVFRGLDTSLNRIVAVKVLSHTQSDDEETLRRFKNEAQSAARLDHENIG